MADGITLGGGEECGGQRAKNRGVGLPPADAREYERGVWRTGRMGRVVGKRPLDKGGKGGGTGAFGRGSEGRRVSWEGVGLVWEERIRGRKASGGGGRRTGASGAAGARGFALGVWLLDKLRHSASGASGRKMVVPG